MAAGHGGRRRRHGRLRRRPSPDGRHLRRRGTGSRTILLRVADSAVLRVRNIRMVCPDCYERVPLSRLRVPRPRLPQTSPRCPAGTVRHRCGAAAECGTPMKTLLLFGSSRMNAYCPYCGHSLEHGPGQAPEIVLPFFGAAARARRACCSAWSSSFSCGMSSGQLTAEFGDAATTRELGQAGTILRDQTGHGQDRGAASRGPTSSA